MAHIGVEALISNMMIHSLSPQGRRLVGQMYTGDPFNIDIKLDSDSKNRSAEIANTYLKTVGRRLDFIKKKRNYDRMVISPVSFTKDPYIHPISFTPLEKREGFDYVKDFKDRQKYYAKVEKSKAESPVLFEGTRRKDRK